MCLLKIEPFHDNLSSSYSAYTHDKEILSVQSVNFTTLLFIYSSSNKGENDVKTHLGIDLHKKKLKKNLQKNTKKVI